MDKNLSQECTLIPLSPTCVDACIEVLLAKAASIEMQLILGFDAVIATKIESGYIYGNGESDIVRKALSDEQFQTVINAFKNIQQVQLNYFLLTGEERANILTALRRLGLLGNPDFPENYSYGGSYP